MKFIFYAGCLSLALIAVRPALVRAQTEPAPPSAPQAAPPPAETPGKVTVHPGVIEYGRDVFLPHLWQGTKAGFATQDSLIGLAAGGALAAAIGAQDEKLKDYFETHELLGDWSSIGDQWGAGAIQPVIVLGMYGWARAAKDQRLATNAEVFAEALILDGVVINVMKPLVGRERPDHSDNLSFPSGHTGNAFTFAALMDARYGHQWGIPMFAVAAYTGLTRMQDHAHWASDVVFGATLGTVIGYAVSKHHDNYPYHHVWRQKTQVTLLPIVPSAGDDRTGVMLIWPL